MTIYDKVIGHKQKPQEESPEISDIERQQRAAWKAHPETIKFIAQLNALDAEYISQATIAAKIGDTKGAGRKLIKHLTIQEILELWQQN